MRRIRASIVMLAVTIAACADTPDPTTSEPAFSNGYGPGASARYEVRFYNLTEGQPFTPPAVATHNASVRLFQVGRAASLQIREIAENGNLGPMVAALSGEQHVADFGVALGSPTLPPLLPGATTVIELDADHGAKWLSWVSMLICTNDGFTGSDRLRLPNKVGDSVEAYTAGYDAGSEINTEDFADIVPPCQALTGVSSGDPGTGTSNPALAENGVIAHHPGIQGTADLVPGVHAWSDPVAHIVVTRIQ